MTPEELDRRFGAPGRLVFRRGLGGCPEAVLANKYGSATVALLGGNTLSYRPTGFGEVLFRSAKRDYARGETVYGGIPVCWPQFGKLAIEGMSGHGFARVMPFEVRGSSYSEEMTEITLGMRSSDDTRALWPHDFDLELKVSVSMKLNLRLVTKNTGERPFAFTMAFHPYFLVRDRDGVSVRGLDGLGYIYADDMTEHVQTGDLLANTATDHVFGLPDAPKHELVLVDPGLGRALAMVSSGTRKAVVWNPGTSEGFHDLAPGDWRKFLCVEPVTGWPKPEGELAPGESSELLVAIQANYL
ncbi:MAG: D-hexose-6-phosphate mutarotase [Kiritimatiellae bacterium]|nr:D-hexose-6-phosphate mutarotase [Kiritimatiellia bacterium]